MLCDADPGFYLPPLNLYRSFTIPYAGGAQHDTPKTSLQRGSRPFSQGGHWDNWNGSGDLDGKERKGEKGRQGGKRRKEGKEGLRTQTNQTNQVPTKTNTKHSSD